MPGEEEREKLAQVIRRWNNNRLHLFEMSPPDENLEFYGVVRFYFEGGDGGNVATKCLRVCSSSSTIQVLQTLSEKFRPDTKALMGKYSLFEIHKDEKNPTERKLDLDEKPLAVQLTWTTEGREGRFVLKADKDSLEENCRAKDKRGVIQTFKRTLSRKKKKIKHKGTEKDSEDETKSTEKPLSSSSGGGGGGEAEEKKICGEKEDERRRGGRCPDASPQLPVQIRFCDKSEDAVLSAVISHSSSVHFKLSPAYVLYAAGRFALQQQQDQRGPRVEGQPHRVTRIANKMAAMMWKATRGQQAVAGALAFWMANSSELLNFLKRDKDLSGLTRQSQLGLSQLVHSAYRWLLQCLQSELRRHLPAFLADPVQHGSLPVGMETVLNTLTNAMSLLRRCRVNPALTIQLFSQLFHFISAWLVNQLLSTLPASASGLRSHHRAAALRRKLAAVEAWAERQGLELAADCHLARIIQATMLLTMNKYSVEDAKDIQNSCFKLNSLQLRALLTGYVRADDEPHIPPELSDAVVTAAEASADELIRSEGRQVRLEESLGLGLPFLLPDGGFSCDTMRGIPSGFLEFLEPICQKGLCYLTIQTDSKGIWTVHFTESTSAQCTVAHPEPDVVSLTLNKPLSSGMGISIVAAKGAGQHQLGIYIKSVVKGGPAERNGMLTAGDQLLSVDGESLIGLSQERAVAIMMKTGTVVTLKVAKFAAGYHGLESLLAEPTSEQHLGYANLESTAFTLHSMNPQPLEHLHGNSRRKKEQLMERNRQLYRSNPNITECFEDRNEQVSSTVLGGETKSVSSLNVCTNTFTREYLTLPTLKSHEKEEPKSSQAYQMLTLSALQSSSKKTSMRQAMSQENLYVEKRLNLWEQNVGCEKQTILHDSSFPIRSSCSAHNILSDVSSATKQQRGSRPSAAGVWRTPQPLAPSTQPLRIDIPLSRDMEAHPQTTSMNQNFQLNRNVLAPPNPDHIYVHPIPAKKKPPQSWFPAQQQSPTTLSPTKHVSFQDPPADQGADVWVGREDQAKLEKPKELCEVELLEQEVQKLQHKEQRTREENDRLQRLSLEWRFQKRLQEIQKKGDNDEEEEEEDLDPLLMIQQLERQTQIVRSSAASVKTHPKMIGMESRPPTTDSRAETGQSASNHINNMAAKEIRLSAPEKLSFRERQSLFSVVSSAEMKVKAT